MSNTTSVRDATIKKNLDIAKAVDCSVTAIVKPWSLDAKWPSNVHCSENTANVVVLLIQAETSNIIRINDLHTSKKYGTVGADVFQQDFKGRGLLSSFDEMAIFGTKVAKRSC